MSRPTSPWQEGPLAPSSTQQTTSQEQAPSPISSPPRPQTPVLTPPQKGRTTLCGTRLQIHKSSIKGRYSTSQPCTLGGIILLDNHPYALLPAKVFLPPIAYSSRGPCCEICDLEHDYVLEEHTTLHDESNSEDVIDETGKPRRNCNAIDQDAEFVVSFMDASLRSLSRVVRIVDHQVSQTSEEERKGSWKACYVNLDCGWAIVDMADAPESLLINEIWNHNDHKPHIDKPLTAIRCISDEDRDGLVFHFRRPVSVCTPRNSPQTAKVDETSTFMYLAGTEKASRKKVLALEYQYAGMGDNGSWLIDPSNSVWWAIIVAEDSGKSYAIPAQTVVENIQKSMGVQKVRLPAPSNTETGSRYFPGITFFPVQPWLPESALIRRSELGSESEEDEESADEETSEDEREDQESTNEATADEEERASALHHTMPTTYAVGPPRFTVRSTRQGGGN